MALLVVLAAPSASWLQVRPAEGAVPSYGVASVLEDPSEHDAASSSASEGVQKAEKAEQWLTFSASSVCDQRSGVRDDLPDALPARALRLMVWDQPWWPLDPPCADPVPEQGVPEELPPTRAPPLTASTAT